MTVRIYHNDQCSKSRAALALLEQRCSDFEVIHYLETPPSAGELSRLLERLKLGARQLLRVTESLYAELGLDDLSLGDEALIAAMCAHPVLIERPIAVAGDRAVIGRPAEAILSIL